MLHLVCSSKAGIANVKKISLKSDGRKVIFINTYYQDLITKAKVQMVLMSAKNGQKMTYRELAKKTGYTPGTVRAFFCRSGRKTDKLAAAIAEALEIEMYIEQEVSDGQIQP